MLGSLTQKHARDDTGGNGAAVDVPDFRWDEEHPEDTVSPIKIRERTVHHPDNVDCHTSTAGSDVTVYWRKAVRVLLTIVLYITITLYYRLSHPRTVVYTCSNGSEYTEPRAVNTRLDTIFETFISESGDKNDAYFCKVKAARAMIQRHPGKRIVYVDEDMVVDLQAVIEDVGCSRLSFFVSPNLKEVLQTPFFCFPANNETLEILEQWWEIKDDYPKYRGGQHDQAAMNDLILRRNVDNTVKVLTYDPTGIEIAHCSHATGDKVRRAQCKANLALFICWDRAIVSLVGVVQFGLWLLPLAVACGFPMVAPGVLGLVFELNPLTLLAALALPRALSPLLVRNNKIPGLLPKMYERYFSGLVLLSMGDMTRLWVPMVGLLRIPRDPVKLLWVVTYIVLLCCLVAFRKRVDRWTCITCPTLYHWLVYSKTAADRCTRLAGSGRWLSVVASGPNMYHLSCGSNTKSEGGVPATRIHGYPSRTLEPEDELSASGITGSLCERSNADPPRLEVRADAC